MTIISIHEKHNSLAIVCGAYIYMCVWCTFIDHHKFLYYYVCYVLSITFNCITLLLYLSRTNYYHQQHKVTDNKKNFIIIIIFRYLIELNCLDWLTFDELHHPLNYYWRLSKNINFSIKISSSSSKILSACFSYSLGNEKKYFPSVNFHSNN